MEKVGLDVSHAAEVAALLDVCDAWPNAQEEFSEQAKELSTQ